MALLRKFAVQTGARLRSSGFQGLGRKCFRLCLLGLGGRGWDGRPARADHLVFRHGQGGVRPEVVGSAACRINVEFRKEWFGERVL